MTGGLPAILCSVVHSRTFGLNRLPCSKGSYFHDRFFEFALGNLCVMGNLGTEPVAVGQAEKAAEAQIGIRCDGTLASNNFTDALGWYIYFFGQTILAESHRFEEFF